MITLLIQLLSFFAFIVLASCWCFGFRAVFHHLTDEVFNYDYEDHWENYPTWKRRLFKPLFACTACMASVHGTLIFFLFMHDKFQIALWIPFCVSLCGLNYLISLLILDVEEEVREIKDSLKE